MKLMSCGQDLGGSIIFQRRLGFSGTPSDLLPLEMGKCQYEQGTDGKMLHYLTSPDIVSFKRVHENWSPTSILDSIATAKPPYHALIDTGALITGACSVADVSLCRRVKS